jgi:hypothetical protein
MNGPTKEKPMVGLKAFLNKAVDVGMLCHPAKLKDPTQSVKYMGLIFDTATKPKLVIVPEDK